MTFAAVSQGSSGACVLATGDDMQMCIAALDGRRAKDLSKVVDLTTGATVWTPGTPSNKLEPEESPEPDPETQIAEALLRAERANPTRKVKPQARKPKASGRGDSGPVMQSSPIAVLHNATCVEMMRL